MSDSGECQRQLSTTPITTRQQYRTYHRSIRSSLEARFVLVKLFSQVLDNNQGVEDVSEDDLVYLFNQAGWST